MPKSPRLESQGLKKGKKKGFRGALCAKRAASYRERKRSSCPGDVVPGDEYRVDGGGAAGARDGADVTPGVD
jgi:hypothetical protein